jgi:glycosyltransferase involved in cell wall biosynthesis
MQGLKTAQPSHPLKVLILNSEFPPIGGGAGTATANLARFMAYKGVDIKIITARFGHLPVEEKSKDLEIIRVPSRRERADRTGPMEQISFIFVSAWYCLTHFRLWKPDVVWAFFGFPSGMTALLLKILYKIPYIVSLRGGDVPGFRPYDFKKFHRIGGPFIKVVWKYSSDLVANSDGLRKLALKFHWRIPIDVIPNGIDLDIFKPSARNGNIPQLLFTGRVVYQKGLDLLVEALSKLIDIPWELSIIGDGSYKDQLHQQIDVLGLTNRIHFHGWCNQKELLPILAQAHIFVNPSRHEGMPNAVLEAMACGLPVIATRIAGNEDLVKDGENGFLVATENVIELRKALRILLTNKQLRQKMGKTSRAIVESNFSWSYSGEKYLALLQKTAER